MNFEPPQVDAWGIQAEYEDFLRRRRSVSRRTRTALRQAMGAAPSTNGTLTQNPVLLLRAGESRLLPRAAEVRLEDGSVIRVSRRLPSDLPIGYHTLRFAGAKAEQHLIVHPGQCAAPGAGRQAGWALQLHSLRSRRSWGFGDLADLRRFARWSRCELGAGFILLNPLAAPLPVSPQEASPYFPSSRLYLNPLYLSVTDIPGASRVRLERAATTGRTLNADQLIDRDAVFHIKMRALERVFLRSAAGGAFDRYRAEQGQTLRDFATFCVLAETYGTGWMQWPGQFRHPRSSAVRDFEKRCGRRVRFHEWIQWQLDRQLAAAAGELPLILDLPIGVNPGGFDAWLWQDLLALDVSVGAPPDAFNVRGQNWGLPPFIPHRLRACGYEPFRRTLQAVLRHAGGVRLDHVMGLFRLFWIPPDSEPRDGGYVRYHNDELLAVLAIESRRAKKPIVGEDLGTVECGVRARLHRGAVLSCRVLWFEKEAPETFSRDALASVTTHDLATVAGLWTGEDLATQQQLGQHPNIAGTLALRQRLQRRAALKETASSHEAVLGAHRLLSRAPSRLIVATLEDALAVTERPNLPGTATERPNWSIALPKTLEEIEQDRFVRKVFETLRR